MNPRTCTARIALVISLLVPAAGAQTYSDDFESYADGSLLHGQGGWHGLGGSPDPYTRISSEHASSGTQSIKISPGSEILREFDHHSGKWEITTKVYVPSGFAQSSYLMFMNAYEDERPWEYGGLFLFDEFNGTVVCHCGGVSNFVAPLIYDTWTEVRLVLDIDADLATIYYEGLLLGSWTWTDGYSGGWNFTTPGFEALEVSGSSAGVDVAFVDDVLVEPVRTGTPYCDADGQGTPCPCANDNNGSAGVAGCANGSSPGGGALRAWGSASLSAADLTLEATGVVAGEPGLFFQGDAELAGGDGVPFGDGLRCAGGNAVRLEVAVPEWPGRCVSTIDVGAAGGASPSDVKRYQFWFRDPDGTPCGSGFNLTNGLAVTWEP